MEEAIQFLRNELQNSGYFLSKIDSFSLFSEGSPPYGVIYARRGNRLRVGEFKMQGLPDSTIVQDLLKTGSGKYFEPADLEMDLDRLLVFLEQQGYLLATIDRPDITLSEENGESILDIKIRVHPGARYTLAGIVLDGAKKTSVRYVEHLSGLKTGEIIRTGMEDIRRDLLATHFFSQVGLPEVIPLSGGLALIRIPLVEETPGAFDLVLGYQPSGASGSASGLVGNGNLSLRNIFGRGRIMALRLHRQPGQISHLETRFSDPFFAGLPFRIELGFEGLQQDSTYNQQQLEGVVGYQFVRGIEALLSVRSEVTEPAQAGVALLNGEQRIPNTRVIFFGGILRMDRRDFPLSPSRGYLIESRYERGQKSRSALQVLDSDTTSVSRASLQERWTLMARGFFPLGEKQVIAIGGEGRILISEQIDESDLFRFGGTTSLRGYEEDRFRGRLVSRSFLEYRYRFERLSYGYLFFDAGYYDRPAMGNRDASSEILYGYGFGFQFDSGVGLINTSFGLGKGDAPSEAKVHIGLSVAL